MQQVDESGLGNTTKNRLVESTPAGRVVGNKRLDKASVERRSASHAAGAVSDMSRSLEDRA